MELEECIKDSIDESMKDYISTNEYHKQAQQIEQMLCNLRNNLSDSQKCQLNQMLDAISSQNGLFASEAYLHGVVEGITLGNKVTMKCINNSIK